MNILLIFLLNKYLGLLSRNIFAQKYSNNEYINIHDKDEILNLVSVVSKKKIDEILWGSILNYDKVQFFGYLISVPAINISLTKLSLSVQTLLMSVQYSLIYLFNNTSLL